MQMLQLFISERIRPSTLRIGSCGIASNESKTLESSTVSGCATADRKWLLDTYAECLIAVKTPTSRPLPQFVMDARDNAM